MTVSFWQDRAKWNLDQSLIEKDIIVIGGGISGMATAYWLAKEDPNLKVAVVERHHIGDVENVLDLGVVRAQVPPEERIGVEPL